MNPRPAGFGATALADTLVLPGLWRFTRLGYRSARRRWRPLSAYLGDRHAVVTQEQRGRDAALPQPHDGHLAAGRAPALDQRYRPQTAHRTFSVDSATSAHSSPRM